ncbi:PH domain-containing protein [Actinocrinis sp.]|uniref:PH domain-containing protein n=1 Tax=Actinocrinis sp. TaxID=1920516 RepID=UPI002D3DB767|nr:hypothetical protein [Actinocrinis sp.]HZP50039.1 hypothetical protein [Actinocrinis sp.]
MTPLATESRSTAEKPTVYRGPAALIGGALVVLFCGFGAIDLLIESGTQDLVAASVLALVAVLAGLYGVYPAAFAWNDRLVVRNPFRTIELPWDAVTDLSARLSFIAHTESRRFTVWAIPVSLRERRRSERHRLRDLSQAQRLAKRGVPADMLQSRNRRPYDPVDRLSFADQAIEEMNARREAYAVQARFKAKEAEQAAAAETQPATASSSVDVSTSAESSSDAAAAQKAASAVEIAPTDSGTVHWSVLSFALLSASVVFLIVALSIR